MFALIVATLTPLFLVLLLLATELLDRRSPGVVGRFARVPVDRPGRRSTPTAPAAAKRS